MPKKQLKELSASLPQRPTIDNNYTKADLIDYAQKRADLEIAGLDYLLNIRDPEKRENDEAYREPLCLDKTSLVKITLSTGGDADGFALEYDKENQLISGLYWWADWGVYEEVGITLKEAEKVAELYNINLDY